MCYKHIANEKVVDVLQTDICNYVSLDENVQFPIMI